MGLRHQAKTFLHLYLKGGDWRLAITKERKEELVAQYADLLDRSRAIIFTEYRGLSNVELTKLRRGGHSYRKLYAAYRAATDHQNAPVAILAKTVKGWTLGEGFEGIEIDSGPGNPWGIKRIAHSVLTEELVDEDGVVTITLDRPAHG